MRKVVLCIGIILSIVLLVSCESLSYGSSDYQSYGSKNRYESTTYSSKFSKDPIDKTEKMVIWVNNSDYNIQRPFELELKRLFTNKGFNVEIVSDYNYTKDNLYSVIDSIDPIWILEVKPSEDGVIRTYQYGGGVSQIGFVVEVYDWFSFDVMMKISTTINGVHNNQETYSSSLESVSKLSSKEIVNEFCKYL